MIRTTFMSCVVARVPGVRKMKTAAGLFSAFKTRSPEVTGDRKREMSDNAHAVSHVPV